MSRAVAGLAHRGLLQLSASQDDGRLRMLSLTREGQSIFDEVAPLARQFETALLEDLSENDRAALDRLLTLLSERLETMEGGSRH